MIMFVPIFVNGNITVTSRFRLLYGKHSPDSQMQERGNQGPNFLEEGHCPPPTFLEKFMKI